MSSPPDSAAEPNPRPPYLLWAALALASALVVALGWQVMQLREGQRWLVERVDRPYVGMFVPKVAATALDGRALSLGQPQGRRQVLFFFNTTCPHCRASLPQLKLAGRELRRHDGVELIGVAFAHRAGRRLCARTRAGVSANRRRRRPPHSGAVPRAPAAVAVGDRRRRPGALSARRRTQRQDPVARIAARGDGGGSAGASAAGLEPDGFDLDSVGLALAAKPATRMPRAPRRGDGSAASMHRARPRRRGRAHRHDGARAVGHRPPPRGTRR